MSILRCLPRRIRPAVIAFALVGVLTGGFAQLAMAAKPPVASDGYVLNQLLQDDGDQGDEDDTAAGDCSECHVDITSAIVGGPHAEAFANPHFQEGWEAQDFDESCLECHTTGFDAETGTYDVEGVTCEACHGEVPDDHPPAPVDLNLANAVCGECHTVTESEFHNSAHAEVGLNCTSCHYAHTNGLRLETETQQCLNCHGDELEGYVAHITHLENDLTCRDCHGYVEPGQPIPPTGLAPTGHDFQVQLSACIDCHEDTSLEEMAAADQAGTGTDITLSGQQAQLRAAQLEAALQTQLLAQRNATVMNIIEGSVGGLLIGGLVVFFLSRRRDSGELAEADEHDDELDE